MGMMKREYTDHLIAVEGVEEGIAHLMKWGNVGTMSKKQIYYLLLISIILGMITGKIIFHIYV
jgi:hypothetical protein